MHFEVTFMEKKRISNEMAYVLGNILVAIGVALMERSDFGVSMVVAPAYVIYRKLSLVLPFFTFGMAEYSFQAVLLIAMCLVLRRFRVSYLFSFVTAVFYGVILDLVMLPAALLPNEGFVVRAILYALGATIGLAPAVTFLRPTLMIACARTVAVVVPSPAWSLVFEATSLTI